MCYRFSLSMIVGAMLVWSPLSLAGVTVTLLDDAGTGQSVAVEPGDTFRVQIQLDIADVELVSAQMRLLADQVGVFEIVSGEYNADDWAATDMFSEPIPDPADTLLDPESSEMPPPQRVAGRHG